jgi:hypothetical protein
MYIVQYTGCMATIHKSLMCNYAQASIALTPWQGEFIDTIA